MYMGLAGYDRGKPVAFAAHREELNAKNKAVRDQTANYRGKSLSEIVKQQPSGAR